MYNNTLFKSQAEARWAVLFDTLDVPWLYEPRCFITSTGGYIPDFQLPALGVWWEVKGAQPTQHAHAAAVSVAAQDGHPVCLSWGSITPTGQVWCVISGNRHVRVTLACCIDCGDVAVRPADGSAVNDNHVYDAAHPRVLAAFTTAQKAGQR